MINRRTKSRSWLCAFMLGLALEAVLVVGCGSAATPTTGTDSSAAAPTAATVSFAPSPQATSTAVAGTTAAPGGGSGNTLDPCSAVTPAELEAILGVSMRPGVLTSNLPSEQFYPKGSTDCVFWDSKVDAHPYVDVKIGPLGDFPPDKVCHPDPRATSTPVSLGDEACWVLGNNADLSELRVRTGSTMVAVVAFIPESQAQHQAATLKVAQLIIGRM